MLFCPTCKKKYIFFSQKKAVFTTTDYSERNIFPISDLFIMAPFDSDDKLRPPISPPQL